MSDSNQEDQIPRLERCLGSLQAKTFDLAIVGGGITGAGIARHASAAGLSVVVLEASDFASGTSSKSTKLIHGGLRYLAMGDIKLVREAALERKSVHQMAPHLAEPVSMVMPLRNRWQWLKFKVGLSVYEALGGVAAGDRHQGWNAAELGESEPALRTADFPHTWAYREYLTDDARLVLAALRAASSNGAECANYVRVESIEARRGQYFLYSRDQLDDAELTIRCRCVVNAAGPWAEQVLDGKVAKLAVPNQGIPNQASGNVSNAEQAQDTSSDPHPRLHLSKGVHIAVPRARLPINNMIFMDTHDNRVIFAIPKGQVTYIGTTDTTYEPGPDRWPPVTDEDIQYLLAPLADYFAGEPLTAADVVSTWAGLRPLIHETGKAAKEMSRKEEVWVSKNGVITIAGGKLTGFRLMAEEVMEQVGKHLQRDVELQAPLATLPGGDFSSDSEVFTPVSLDAEIARIGARYQVDDDAAGRLVRLYGTEVEDVLGESPRAVSGSVFAEEVDWAIETDGAISLEDVIYRRLRSVWYEPAELAELLPAVADRMAGRLDWSAKEQQRQRIAVEERIAFDLAAVPLRP